MTPALPPGFRFHPTEEELVAYYLKRKICGGQMEDGIIGEVDLYKCEPWDLQHKSLLQSGFSESEWFFFNARDKKYSHGSRTNRATKAGYWKATGKDRKVCSGGRTVGMRKTLVFYMGRTPRGERTDWVMQEYRLEEDFEKGKTPLSPFVLCRIRRKSGPQPSNAEQDGDLLLDDEKLPGLREKEVEGALPNVMNQQPVLTGYLETPSQIPDDADMFWGGLEAIFPDLFSGGLNPEVDSFLESLL